jgi:hypothetical protein
MMHEMGHVFSVVHGSNFQSIIWSGEVETGAEFLVAYALEKGGFRHPYTGSNAGSSSMQHRRGIINHAMKNIQDGKIKDFGGHEGTTYEL